MKQIAIVLLFAAMLLQTFNRVVIVSGYYTNAYAKNCENKAKPQLHCNGKCQMMKKLKQEEKKDAQHPERKQAQDEVLSSKSFFAEISPISAPAGKHHKRETLMRIVDRAGSIFHPPSYSILA